MARSYILFRVFNNIDLCIVSSHLISSTINRFFPPFPDLAPYCRPRPLFQSALPFKTAPPPSEPEFEKPAPDCQDCTRYHLYT